MMNLLPEEAKMLVRRIYHRHLLVVIFGFIVFLVTVSILFTLPSLFLLKIRTNELRGQLAVKEASPISKQATTIMDIVKITNEKISLLETTSKIPQISVFFDNILMKTTAGISLSSIDWDGAENIAVRGRATTREGLTAFLRLLEADPIFSNITSPISNLISSGDIDFSISFKIKQSNG